MKTLTHICIAALAATSMAAPAVAQTVTPANSTLTAVGPATLTKGATVLNCTLTLNGMTGPDIGGNRATGGTISGGTNTGGAGCSVLTVDGGATFTITSGSASGGTGNLNNLTVRLNGSPVCVDAGPLPFTITNTGATTSTISFNSPVDPDCNVQANLSANVAAAP